MLVLRGSEAAASPEEGSTGSNGALPTEPAGLASIGADGDGDGSVTVTDGLVAARTGPVGVGAGVNGGGNGKLDRERRLGDADGPSR